MSQQAGYSPSFKRPADILRMRRKRARSEASVGRSSSGQGSTASPGRGGSSSGCVRPFSPGPLFSTQSRSAGGVKRRNPFANIENTYNSPKKRLVIYNDEGDAAVLDSVPFKKSPEKMEEKETSAKKEMQVLPLSEMLAEAERQENQVISSKKRLTFSEDDSLFDEEEEEQERTPLHKSPQASAPGSIAPPVCTEYPTDWSLKTRLLFTSPLPFSWAEHPKAQEEAKGLTQHCRAQHSTLPLRIQDAKSCTELRAAFQQSLVYWQHPSLPWLSLFPRINAEKSFTGKSAPWAHDTALQQSLMSEWSVSLSSLYSLLKAKLCPYFYLCSYQFTVLFRAAGLNGSSSITALLSPSTRGLREAMKAAGIEFTLPLVEERRKSRDQHTSASHQGGEDKEETDSSEWKRSENSQGEDGDDDNNDYDEDGEFSWLKEMGVHDKIKKPDSITIQLRKEHKSVSLDHKPESLVRVEGPHTFTLINFLINCKSLVAAAGSQAGLPPTLLAPTPFRGATMHTLKARSVNVKTQVRSAFQDVSSLEVSGPILPSALHAITGLLRPAQRGSFSAALYTHAPTAVMNTRSVKEQVDSNSVDLSACGLQPPTVQQLQRPSTLGKTALRQIHMTNYSYTWKN